MKRHSLTRAAMLACIAALPSAAPAQHANTTQATLLDRIQIEELITGYYANLGGGGADDRFAAFYTEDATLDINGSLFHGRAEIENAYKPVPGTTPMPRVGTFRMLLNNPVIEVKGSRATASFIWTGIQNDTIKGPPRLSEQGREFDLLVKSKGGWRIQHRTIIADSGLPDRWERTYTPRPDYDISKEK